MITLMLGDIVELMDVVVIDRGRDKFGSDGMCLYFDAVPIIAILAQDNLNLESYLL